MTSFNVNHCSFRPEFNRQHMLDPDPDGNIVCQRPGCYHHAHIVCTCRIDPEWTKYIGCPTHTENPRIPYPKVAEYGTARLIRAIAPWLPEDAGGDLTQEQADHSARELRHRSQ